MACLGGFFSEARVLSYFSLVWLCAIPRATGGGDAVAKSYPTLMSPWTVAHQAPLSMGFSRQEYWSGLPFPSPGDLPHPGMELRSTAPQANSLPTELWRKLRRQLNKIDNNDKVKLKGYTQV